MLGFDEKSGYYDLGSIALLAKYGFDKSVKEEVEDMVPKVRASYSDLIRSASWLSSETKQAALLKLDKMQSVIGYTEDMMDEALIAGEYEGLKMDKGQLLRNVQALEKKSWFAVFRNEDESIRARRDRLRRLKRGLLQVNAYNIFSGNFIALTPGYLEEPQFILGAPFYMNLASIGLVIGHEISHGFDNNGRKFDEEGKIYPRTTIKLQHPRPGFPEGPHTVCPLVTLTRL